MAIIPSILFLIWTAICSIVSIPISLIDRSGRWYLSLARAWARFSLILFGVRIAVFGREHVQPGHNYVYVSNHASYLDVLSVIASVPDNIRLIFRESLLKVPIWGWSMRFAPFIVIDRTNPLKAKTSLAKAVETIRNGASVLLFAEGTRTSTGEMQPLKRGAFRLAFDSKVAVIPVAVKGTFEALPRTAVLPKLGQRVSITLGEPLHQSTDPSLSDRDREFDLMHRTEASIRSMLQSA